MAKTRHTRNGKVRKHTNRTTGSHMNGKRIDTKKRGYQITGRVIYEYA